ncbi:glutamine synthetase family protein [Aeromicrobium sp. 9AM]|uniref:glutamine synthetase family protein n=1 Tax=Aeromicrobium sp. 9AM TaxID=2653126 RepID=UPI0012EF034C|nr:glutamine synthetase family protein [Aeromicrobium sp. 9AM]VXB62193.1 Glutamine synthetase [Aeromicrobium sp. 9AM]
MSVEAVDPASGPIEARFDDDSANDLLARGVRVIRVLHTDLFGRQRAKQVPVRSWLGLRNGLAYSKMASAEDLFGEAVSADEFPGLASHPDLHATIDPSTARIPSWEPDAVWVLATLHESGERSALCPRGQLEHARDALDSSTGLRAVAAGEPEFFLFRNDAGQPPSPYSTDGVSYTMDRMADPEGVVGRIHRSLIDFGIGVSVVNREFSPGQFEINLVHDEVLAAADAAFLLKSGIKELASLEGLSANFMAKPRTVGSGSSLHVHLSLWDGERNVFADESNGVSDLALHAIAGLQAHAAALMAFAGPTVNSYRRMAGEGLSPNRSNWGVDNRFSFVRIPPELGDSTRLELRAGDASASPHLLMAAMLHAIRDGIENRLDPSQAGQPLPIDLGEAIAALRKDDMLREGLGDELIDVYSALKQREVDGFRSHVTDWEWGAYASQV